MRSAFLADERAAALSAAIQLSRREARHGAVLPLQVPVRCTCHDCGGRGETWAEPCVRCEGSGSELKHHQLQVAVPAGVLDGTCFHFSVTPRYNPPTRVELRVLVRLVQGTGGPPRQRFSASSPGSGVHWLCWWACRCFSSRPGRSPLSAGPEGETVTLAAGLTAVVFVSIGVFSLVWGVAHMWAAVLLRRRAPSGRLLTLGLGVVNLLVFPFGTALGGYALWILLTHEGRRLFEAVGRPQAEGAIR